MTLEKLNYFPRLNFSDSLFLLMSSIVGTLLGLVLPFSILIIFDRVLPNNSTSTLYYIYAIILASIVLDYKIKAIEGALISKIGLKFESKITNQLFHAIGTPYIDKFKKLETGEYLERLNTIPALKAFFSGDVISSLINLFTCLITLLIISIIDLKIGTILIIASIFLFIVSYTISNKKIKLLQMKSEIEGLTNSKVIEIISYPHDIKSRAMEYRIENLMKNMLRQREHYNTKFEEQQANYSLLLNLVQQLSVTFVVITSASAVINMEMSQGIMAAIILLTNRYFGPYQQAMRTTGEWKVNRIYIDQLNEILEIEKKFDQQNDTEAEADTEKSMLPVININNQELYFRADKINILSGLSGSGKSSVFKHLLQSTEPTLTAIQNNMVVVDKDSTFIEGTIIDNLTCFRPQLQRAAYLLCEALSIKHELDSLKLGFFTEISSKNNTMINRQIHFSLLLVRALLSDKHIILIDDFDLVYDAQFVINMLSCMLPRTRSYTFVIVSNKINQRNSQTNIIKLGD